MEKIYIYSSEQHLSHRTDEWVSSQTGWILTCEIARAYVFSVPKAMADNFQSIYRACY
jgi:hypothetical protein